MSRRVRHLYEFGPFRLDPEKPCLWRNGEPVALTPKAVETLLVLIRQNGKLVARKDLMDAIWPNTFVEDGNLNFNVSMLRKALGTDEAGEQYIQTIPRHGYRFSADVREVNEEVPALVVERYPSVGATIEERELGPPAEPKETEALTVVAGPPEPLVLSHHLSFAGAGGCGDMGLHPPPANRRRRDSIGRCASFTASA